MTLGLAAKRHLARQVHAGQSFDQAQRETASARRFQTWQPPALHTSFTTCGGACAMPMRARISKAAVLYRFSMVRRQRHEPATLRHDAP
jgi:hypothetical protein